MSAIAGIWSWGTTCEPDPSCGRMLAALRSYGPHAQDRCHRGDIALGRCLFRTLPEDEFDRQPLTGAGGRYVLVADIRLDNREELLSRLGHVESHHPPLCDAAVLLLGFERWGRSVLDLIAGDYAFAVWDSEEESLFLARDPLGECPLYFHSDPSMFAFASMPKGIHALGTIPRAPDPAKLATFVGLVPEMGRASYYAGIEQIAPGHSLEIRRGSAPVSRRYWNPQRRDLGLKSFSDYRDSFREHLDQAVRSRLRGAGRNVASHLSSGWDSGAVTATAARLLAPSGGRVQAYTAAAKHGTDSPAYRGRIMDEAPLAAKTAAMHGNIDHYLVAMGDTSLVEGLDRYVDLYDRPAYNLCNQVWLCEIRRQAAARGNTVLLTGQMGNFTISSAPYMLLADLIRERRWRDWLIEAKRIAAAGDARYRGIAASSFGPWVPNFVWKWFRPLSSRPETGDFSALHPSLRAPVGRIREQQGVGLAARSSDYFKRTVRAMSFYDAGSYRKGALAGWGIDERDPTADRRLVEFCLSLPVEMLLKGGVRRPLARAALEDRLPAEVLDEKRKGLQASDWHLGLTADRQRLAGLVEEIAGSETAQSLVDVESLREWIHDWPSEGWETPAISARYRGALLGAASAGHFVLATTR